MTKIQKVAIVGTGVIGAGWIIRCLAHNKIVHAYDQDIKLKKNLIVEIKRTWPYVKKLINMMDLLEDLDDIQNIYSNFDIDESDL